MKRMMILILAAMLLTCTALAEAPARTGADLSYGRIVEMAQYMRELVMGDYLDIKQVPAEQQTIAEGWAQGITDTPRMVVQLDINSLAHIVQTRAYFSQEADVVAFEAESTAVVEVWQTLAYQASMEASLTEASYEDIMTVNSQLGAFRMYAEEGTTQTAAFFVLYDNAAPILLLVTGENGGVAIQGMFLPSAKLAKCQNYGQVSLYLMLSGFTMTCREILPE